MKPDWMILHGINMSQNRSLITTLTSAQTSSHNFKQFFGLLL